MGFKTPFVLNDWKDNMDLLPIVIILWRMQPLESSVGSSCWCVKYFERKAWKALMAFTIPWRLRTYAPTSVKISSLFSNLSNDFSNSNEIKHRETFVRSWIFNYLGFSIKYVRFLKDCLPAAVWFCSNIGCIYCFVYRKIV